MMASVDTSGLQERSLSGAIRRMEGSLRPRLQAFWRWWTRALAAWLPERTRELFGLIPQRLLLRQDGEVLHLALLRGEDVREGGAVPLADVQAPVADPLAGVLAQRVADVPRWLLLPAGSVLRRTMTLPAAAADHLREVLAFEIDRQTPFTQADVYHDARLLSRRGNGQVDAELVVVPKAMLEARLAALGPLAATLAGVDVEGPDGRPLGVDMLAGQGGARREDPWRRWNLVLAGVGVLALAAAMWQMLANRRAVAEVYAREVEQVVQQAREASAERRKLQELVEGMRHLQQVRAARPTMVEVIDELTARLPDSTYLDKLSVEGDRVLLIGLSAEASALVRQLEGSKLWRDPALAGVLQPDPRMRKDRFTLTARLVAGNGGTEAGDGAR